MSPKSERAGLPTEEIPKANQWENWQGLSKMEIAGLS